MKKNMQQGRRPAFLMLKQRLSRLLCIKISLIMLSFLVSQYHMLPAAALDTATVTPVQQARPVAQQQPASPEVVQTPVQPETAQPISLPPQVPVVVIPAVESCTANYSYNSQPNGVSLPVSGAGVFQQHDAPYYYQVFGYTSSVIRQQMAQCGPNGVHAAETAYAINWSYAMSMSDNVCKVADVRIGIRTTMTLPTWQPSQHAEAGLQAKWQRFAVNVHVHEDGHVAVSRQYAQILHDSLLRLPATECGAASATAVSVANSIVQQLHSAQRAYDAHTGHGATQGAIF